MRKMRQPTGHHVPYHKDTRAVLVSVAGAFIALIVFGWIYGSNYTGYAEVSINTMHVGETAYGGTRLVVSSADGKPIPMNAARISGRLYGSGTARVFLAVGETKLLVFSNTKGYGKASPLIEPVGIADRSRILDESSFSMPKDAARAFRLDVIEDENLVFDTSAYHGRYKPILSICDETCGIHGKLDSEKYTFVFDMDPGTAFEVDSIAFS